MKQYIGDGCYAEWDGYAVTVTTSDGVRTLNEVVLDPEVFDALVAFRNRARSGPTWRSDSDG